MFFTKLLCCFVTLFLTVPATAEGAGLTLELSKTEYSTGDIVQIDFSISENSGAAMAQFCIAYDDGLELVSVKSGDVFNGLSAPTINSGIDGEIYFAWDALGSLKKGGTVLSIKFKNTGGGSVRINWGEEFLFADDSFSELAYNMPADTIYIAPPDLSTEQKLPESGKTTEPIHNSEQKHIGHNNGLELEKNEFSIKPGGTARLQIHSSNSNQLVWTSSNEAVATVKDGEIIALSEGEAIISVMSTEDGGEASCVVTVGGTEPGVPAVSKEQNAEHRLSPAVFIIVTTAAVIAILIIINRKNKAKPAPNVEDAQGEKYSTEIGGEENEKS